MAKTQNVDNYPPVSHKCQMWMCGWTVIFSVTIALHSLIVLQCQNSPTFLLATFILNCSPVSSAFHSTSARSLLCFSAWFHLSFQFPTWSIEQQFIKGSTCPDLTVAFKKTKMRFWKLVLFRIPSSFNRIFNLSTTDLLPPLALLLPDIVYNSLSNSCMVPLTIRFLWEEKSCGLWNPPKGSYYWPCFILATLLLPWQNCSKRQCQSPLINGRHLALPQQLCLSRLPDYFLTTLFAGL